MRELFARLRNNHPVFLAGSACSIILLTGFLIGQSLVPEILELESRWLIVSGAPLLIALFVGGYVTSFKGFGVELEAKLKRPVEEMELGATTSAEAARETENVEKGGISALVGMAEAERRRIKRLSFIEGRKGYYGPRAIRAYLQHLNQIEFIEIKDKRGKFIALIPAAYLEEENRVLKLIESIEDSDVVSQFQEVAITEVIREDLNLVDALKAMRKERLKRIVVVDFSQRFVGVLSRRDAEKRIIEDVLGAKENN